MENIRIIPRIDIKGQNLVKGVHLEGLRVLGKPEDFARKYYEEGADEIIFQDVVASLYGRNSLENIIKRTADEIFIPLTVGGGIRNLEDIKRILRAGADKVSINTAAIKNPELIKDASKKFGSSTIVVSIEAIEVSDNLYMAYTDNGREETVKEVITWAQEVESLGAGEILLTSINREGTGQGYDLKLVQKVGSSVSIPVIACGGAGKIQHIEEVIKKANADAVSVASILHYGLLEQEKLPKNLDYAEGNIDFLKSGKTHTKFHTTALIDLKKYLTENNIKCRYDYEK